MTIKGIDRTLLVITTLLVLGGFLIFSSASLGLLAREGAQFSSVASNQFLFGIVGGSIALLLMSQIHYRNWRKYAFYVFAATLLLTLAVFIEPISLSHGGARRWIVVAGFSFQPAELLKIGFVIYMATWLSGIKHKVTDTLKCSLPFFGIVAGVGVIMLLQPDTDTFLVMATAATAMFLVAGGRWRDVLCVVLIGVLLLSILIFTRPYIQDRVMTFLNPASDPLGAGYQINQSLIAVGSGGATGRGFGQSIQKFEYLPEPIGDSIFAVYAEEFGFVGSVSLIALLAIFTFRGYKIASRARDKFGMLLVVGFMSLIVVQAFLNIASMVGLAPLSGLPLPFISHGGTALLATLAMVGVVLNVSKYQSK